MPANFPGALPPDNTPNKRRGLIGRLKDAIYGRTTRGFEHGPNDGIVHRQFVKAFAERSAVAQALQKMGYTQMDPAKHRQVVDDHTRVAAWLAHNQPDNPLVKHYTAAAEQLNDPDVVKPTADPTKIGDFPEPPRHTYYTVPNVGPAGKDLADAATPLVRFVNTLLARAKKQPALMDVVKEREPTPEPEPKPEPKPAPLRPTSPWRAPLPPLKLPNYPGETGRKGDRWADMGKLVSQGAPRVSVVRHLMDKYALSARAAAATYQRYMKHAAKKLARKLWVLRLARGIAGLITNKNVDPRIAGTRLAYHLLELVRTYAKTQPRIAELAKRCLTGGRTAHNTDVVPPNIVGGTGGDPYAALGDELKRYTSTYGTAVKGWRDQSEPAVRVGTAYNWHKMDKGLAAEQYMRTYLRSIVKRPEMTDKELFAAAERQFDRNPGDKEKYLGHWVETHAAGKDYKVKDLHDAIRRLADREDDRWELAFRKQPVHKATDHPSEDTHWRQAFRWNVANQHAKFKRERRK